jgi:hypothetical protein
MQGAVTEKEKMVKRGWFKNEDVVVQSEFQVLCYGLFPVDAPAPPQTAYHFQAGIMGKCNILQLPFEQADELNLKGRMEQKLHQRTAGCVAWALSQSRLIFSSKKCNQNADGASPLACFDCGIRMSGKLALGDNSTCNVATLGIPLLGDFCDQHSFCNVP